MSERLALLFADDAILVMPEGTKLDVAFKEAEEHDCGASPPHTLVVRLKIEITEFLNLEDSVAAATG